MKFNVPTHLMAAGLTIDWQQFAIIRKYSNSVRDVPGFITYVLTRQHGAATTYELMFSRKIVDGIVVEYSKYGTTYIPVPGYMWAINASPRPEVFFKINRLTHAMVITGI